MDSLKVKQRPRVNYFGCEMTVDEMKNQNGVQWANQYTAY